MPWDDITGFVLWRPDVGVSSVLHVGVTRREGAPSLPGDGPKSRAVLDFLAPVSPDTAVSSRPVTGWLFDQDRLITAVAHFAPGLPVQDDLWPKRSSLRQFAVPGHSTG